MRFSWGQWLRSLSRPRVQPIRTTRRALRHVQLEALEDRTAPAALPAPVVGNPTVLTTSFANPQGNHPLTDAQILVDPRNPQHVVAVASYNPTAPNDTTIMAGLRFWFSTDAGTNWSLPQTINNDLDVTHFPPAGTPQRFLPVNESASLAFDTLGSFYIASNQHDAANAVGLISLHKFNFSGATPVAVDLDPVRLGANPAILYRWIGADQDPAFNPVVAVDTNVGSFTDPTTGAVQTDALASNVSKAAFVTITSGGSGYTVGDVLAIQGGTFRPGAQAQVQVTSVNGGAITGVTLVDPGIYVA